VDLSVQLNPFHAALAAFEIRFDRELTSRWQNLEYKAWEATDGSPSEKRRSVLYRFFEDAEREIGNVVHEYFPKLLQVATTQRKHLGNDAPLAWTQAQVLRQVCTFLGVDEKFDFTLAPRDESRLVVATARIDLGIGWRDDDIPADFVFPGWLSSDWLLRQNLDRLFPSALNDAESLPLLSRAETLQWIKDRELWMRLVLDRQIDNDSWDGIIEAGKSDVSVQEAFDVDASPDGKKSKQNLAELPRNSFVREAATWAISFGDETCRLKPMIGLDYISVLLQSPGKSIRALELQSVAGGLRTGSSADSADAFTEKTDDQGDRYLKKSDFERHVTVDDHARNELEKRLLEIEEEIAYRSGIGDKQVVKKLEDENATLESYLRKSRTVRGRPRVFSNENEKARTSISHALRRAYESIREQAPQTEAHPCLTRWLTGLHCAKLNRRACRSFPLSGLRCPSVSSSTIPSCGPNTPRKATRVPISALHVSV
jgi:hypothetical protein